jgi:hypothetical protein
VEEHVTESPTVIERDDSWLGRTIVALVVIALLVVGTVWLVRSIGDNNNSPNLPDDVNVNVQNDNPAPAQS